MPNIANVEINNGDTFGVFVTRTNEAITRLNSIANTLNVISANSATFTQNNSINFVTLYNNSPASIANESRILFNFNDTASEDTFGWISVRSADPTNSSEDGDMEFAVSDAGATVTKLTIAANGQIYVPLGDNYENSVTANNVITNKKYVDDQDLIYDNNALAYAIALG